MTSSVAFDGFPLTGTTPLGGKATLTGLDGWLSKSLSRDRQVKAQQDGAWSSTGFSAAPQITATGYVVYATAAAAAAERRTMLVLGGRGSAVLTVTDALGTLTRNVEVDMLSVPPVRDTMLAFTLVATAVDPLAYGPQTLGSASLASIAAGAGRQWPRVWPTDWGVPAGVTPGAVTMLNKGTAWYWPVMRINGPVVNPQVSLGGDVIRYNATLPAGQHLDLNWGTPRRATIGDNPVSVRNLITATGNWCAVPPGGASIAYSADTADPAATLTVWGYEGAYE